MSARAGDYAAAVLALEAEGASSATIAKGLARTLVTRGHQRLAPRILRELESQRGRRARRERITLTLAHERDAKRFRKEIAAALATLGAEAAHETCTDEALVGGFILESGTERHDASYRHSLRSLYRRLVSTSR